MTNVGGSPELVTDSQTGYVIPPNHPDMLAERILDLLGDPAKRRQMGEQAARRVQEELNWNRVADRVIGHLEQVMGEKSGG